jgi:hypothetical protein
MLILAAILLGMGSAYWAGSQRGRELERAEIGAVVEMTTDGWRERGVDGVWRPYKVPTLTWTLPQPALPGTDCVAK